MAQWQALLRLDSALQSRVIRMYEQRFRRDIRHSLCDLIESHDWDSAAVDEHRAATCFQSLLVCLEEQWKRSVKENNILQGPDFSGMRDYLLMNFKDEPMTLALVLSQCLQEEKNILSSTSEAQGCHGGSTVDSEWSQLDNKISELKRQTLEVTKEMKSLEGLNEKLSFLQETWQNHVEQKAGLAQSNAVVEERCVEQANFIMHTKQQMLLQQIANILNAAAEIVQTLTGVMLPEWKRRQQMACLGNPVDTPLDHLEKWFTAVTEVLIGVHKQLPKLQAQNVAEMTTFTLSLLVKLLENALVVEKQPVMSSLPQRPLILKTGVRFTAKLRFLANLPEFRCLLRVTPVFDKDVEETMTIKGFRHFDFDKGDSKVLDEDLLDGGLVAEFEIMTLKETKSKAKGSSETRLGVTEELHVIKFVTTFQHAGLQVKVEASSLPVVVISSTNQVPSAWASIMWCNILCTSEPRNLSLFVDPPPITWNQLSQVLNWQFLSVGQRGLDENQLLMLRDKIVDNPDIVQWSKFSKNEGVWIWIDGILDLIKKHLVDLWREGFIMGFVSRQRTRALLQEKQTGTFLLRFSESNKEGAITFSWVEHSNGETHVHAVEPYNKVELSAMSLPDIIYLYSLKAERSMTRNPLLYLYPDIPKDAAFRRYYKNSAVSQPKKVVDGYVDRTLVPVSVYPTPPSSPPREGPFMEVDTNFSLDDEHDLIEELFSDLFDFSSHPELWTIYQQMPPTQIN